MHQKVTMCAVCKCPIRGAEIYTYKHLIGNQNHSTAMFSLCAQQKKPQQDLNEGNHNETTKTLHE